MNFFETVNMGSFEATRLGLGTARLGAFWQGRSVGDGRRCVEAALDLGINLVDTADVYGRGLSERIVGRAVGRRDNVVVITKVGLLKTPSGLARAARASGRAPGVSGVRAAAPADTCFEADYVRRAAHACLRRQGRAHLDVLMLHEPSSTDLQEGRLSAAVDRLRRDGDVVDFGASLRTAEQTRCALALPDVSWLQIPANAAVTQIAEEVAQHPRAAEVAILAIGVLGAPSTAGEQATRASVPERLESAVRLPGIDGALLGMSTPTHVEANVAALHRQARARETAS